MFNAIGRFGSMALSLFMTPYIVGKLGNEAFGVWALLFAATDFARLFDLGIATAYMKHIAEFHARGDDERVNQVINTALIFSTCFSLAILGLGLVLSGQALRFFKCDNVEYAAFTLVGVLVILSINYSLMIFRAVLNGLQRLDLVHGAYLATSVIGAICTIVLLELGMGLKGLVVSTLVVTVLCSTTFMAFAWRVFPQMRLSFAAWDWAMFRKLFRFGIQIQVAMISETVNAQIDKILLGHFIAKKAFITFYDVGGRISGVVRSVSWSLLGAIEAASAELYASDRHEVLADLYVRASKYVMAATAPLCVFTIVFADEIMLLYMGGPGFELAAVAVRFLSISYCAFLFCGVPKCVARGMGILGPEMGAALVVLVLNASLSLVLVLKYGFTGALTGTTVASLVGYLYYMTRFHRMTAFSLWQTIRYAYLGAAMACVGATGATWFVSRWVAGLGLPQNRAGYGVALLAEGAVFFGLYASLAFALGYISRDDVATITQALNWRILGGKKQKPDSGA